MTEHWQHYAHADYLRNRALAAKLAMSDEQEKNDFLLNNHAQTNKLDHEIRLFGGSAKGAARIFTIDCCEAVAPLR